MNARRLTAVLLSLSGLACADSRSAVLGERLFNGDPPLTARLSADPTLLPAGASRCSNCHEPTGGDAGTFGSQLTADALLTDRRRRGGPPSRYDRKRFCALLRTGIDPTFVVIDRAMPRYELSDESCEALWNYVRSRS